MPARSSLVLLALAGVLAGCAPKPQAPPMVTAPVPVPYTCEQQRRAAAELAALPPGAMLGVMIGDYQSDRRQSRRALGLPDPTPCPAASS
jgi:hypothetical protein